MYEKKWFTSADFCIVDIAKSPTIAARFRCARRFLEMGDLVIYLLISAVPTAAPAERRIAVMILFLAFIVHLGFR